ncbi:hypothetical protein PGTUg99_013128 [Puccinia graminis f. sp. tritici]|uniref:Uncharacterized protein n=1 Tax=Puccinia graminis f. sp. tritici TaxID=56615 RepID=A0A5B0SFU1_PUCGR|nr:hypothetical protein PGTUg99_013128 [Puccinia graminis f. sp. tritici]
MRPPANLQPTCGPRLTSCQPQPPIGTVIIHPNSKLFSIPSSLVTPNLSYSFKNRLSDLNCLNLAMQPSTENNGMGEYQESYIGQSQMSQTDGASCRVFFEPSQDNGGYIPSHSDLMQGIPLTGIQMPPGLHAANHQGSIGHHPAGQQVTFPTQAAALQGQMGFAPNSLGQLTGMPMAPQGTFTSNQTGNLMAMPAVHVVHKARAPPHLTRQAAVGVPIRALSVAPTFGSGGEDEGRPILIDYIVFIRSAQNQAVGSSKSTPSVKEWDRLAPTAETVFKTDITRWDWPSLQARILSILEGPHDPFGLDGPGKLLRKHFETLADSGLLKWQCVLNSHRTYGHIGHYYVTCDEEWKVFVNVACHKDNLAKKIFIKLLMDDPRKTVKAAVSDQKQTDNLVAQYGSKSEQIALERLQSRLAKNPKADVDAKGRVQKIADLSTYICEKYGANAESMRIKDPDDPEKSIRITSNGLSIWGRNHTIRLKNWNLRTNSPLVTTEASLEYTWINSYPTMDNISQGFHPSIHYTNPNYNPQATQTPSVQYTLIYIYTLYTLLHFTSTYYIIPAA